MATKDEIMAMLDEAGIEYDPSSKKAELEELLPEKEEVKEESEIVMKDPEDLRPKELPLIVELPKDASMAQVEYAKVINSYAYQNPDKFRMKKDMMLKKLEELKNAPDPIKEGMLTVNNTLV